MTLFELISYYADLLILQYRGKSKARAHVKTLVTPIVMDQLPLAVQNAYDITTAVGVQLDVLGKYVGISRYGYNFAGAVTLNDADFRTIINQKIYVNKMDSSLSAIQVLITTYFAGVLQVYDYQNMHISYVYLAVTGANPVAEFFIRMVGLPRPMGVQRGFTVYAPTNPTFFGFQTYQLQDYRNHGFNTYSVYDSSCPWLLYTNALSF